MATLVELLKNQRNLELDYRKALKPTIRISSKRLVSALLESIVFDSGKHAMFCKALMEIASGKIPREANEGEAIEMTTVLKEHISVESKMISNLESMLKKVEDERVKGILDSMLSDERRHHNSLKRISDLITNSKDQFEEYFNLFEKYMYSGPDHGHKTYKR